MNKDMAMKLCVLGLFTVTSATQLPFDPNEKIQARSLFNKTKEFFWEIDNERVYKCCESSAGKPTKIANMLAEEEELPAARRIGNIDFGVTTGCGFMFGNTYHNGPKGHEQGFFPSFVGFLNRLIPKSQKTKSEPTCVVPASKIVEIWDSTEAPKWECEMPKDLEITDLREGDKVWWKSYDAQVPDGAIGTVSKRYKSRDDDSDRVLVQFPKNPLRDYRPRELCKVGTSACDIINTLKKREKQGRRGRQDL
jgi:hypothetical protein